MTKFPINKIQALAKDDYEKAWLETADYLELKGNKFELQKKGKSHAVQQFISNSREKMIELGFEEIMLPMFVEEDEVYDEYGPEAALILDRLFYIAELPRPEIGVSNRKINIIKEIVPGFDSVEQLQGIFRRYKKGEIEADDLVETMVEELNIEESHATGIIERAFPEFKELKPLPTKKTLRSHTTALWFPVLAELYKKKPLPLQYFLIGPKWRREQKVDQTHLICSNTLSITILADEITLEDGKNIGRRIAKKIGFDSVKVETKTATSKYYAPQMEFEIFVQHPTTEEWIEIGDGGFYSPVSLANFGIDRPVLNIGFGVERIVMILTDETDIRNLVFPYYYTEISFSDEEIASLMRYDNIPKTDEGKEIAENFVKLAIKNADVESPVEFTVWSGDINDRDVKIKIWEKDSCASLLGVAARNEFWVDDGNIICRSYDTEHQTGVKTRLSVLEGIANEIAAKAEELSVEAENPKWSHRIRMPRRPNQVNLHIDDKVMYFIHSRKKKIDIHGPVFIGVDIEVDLGKENQKCDG